MRPRSVLRILAAVALVTAVAVPSASPIAAASGREYRLDLLEPGDFVTQHTDVTCVGASVQTMLNIVREGADTTRATQRTAQRTAQRMSNPIYVRRSGGASARGWAYALERLGGGPYRIRAYGSRTAALNAVAEAIRTTSRPAGLLVWGGAHAWVASGFRATADPAGQTRFRVASLVVSDPWWPRPVGSHGATMPPGTELKPAALGRHFVLFQRGPRRGGSSLNGSFVVVLPVDPAAVAEKAALLR